MSSLRKTFGRLRDVRSNLRVVVSIVASVTLLTGCPAFTDFRSARALAPGQLQLTGAAQVLGMAAPTSSGLGGARPSFGFAARYGVANGVDIGVKLDPVAGGAFDGTFQLVQGPVDFALGPGLSYFSTPVPVGCGSRTVSELASSPDYTIVAPSLPLLLGFNFGPGHQLVVEPRVSAWLVQPQASQPGGSSVAGGMEVLTGLTTGVSFKTWKQVRVMPEVNVTVPLAWTGEGSAQCSGAACAPIHPEALVAQGGIAIIVGPDHLGP